MNPTSRFVALFCLGLAPALVSGQVRPYPVPTPVYPGGYYPGRYGGMLYGAADVTRAQGDVMIQQEQARIAREQANQAKIDTQRKAFDEAAYEKANTPTYVEKEIYAEQQLFQRILVKPTLTEITTGRAQNIMLPQLDRMALQGIFGAPIPLDQDQLKLINITLPGKTGMSMLTDVKNIAWPLALVGPTQEKLQTTLDKTVASVRAKGRVDPKQYMECQVAFKNLRGELDKKFDEEKINMSRFAEGSTFMQNLNKEIALLADPAAAKMLTGVSHPQAADVLDLVAFMTTKGLQFAPARPGDESAYQSLYSAMRTFAQTAQVASGVSARPTDPGPPPSKKFK